MSLLLRNVVSTFAGTAWVGVMTVVLAPFVLDALGAEGYGLLGVFITMQGLAVPIGSAVGSVLTRETARLRRLGEARRERELVSTMEILYISCSALIAAVLIAAAPLLSRWWIHAQHVPFGMVVRALRLIGLAVALQLPIAAYSGALMGLEKHVVSNFVNAVSVTVRTAVAILLLLRLPGIEVFFAWQVAATLGHLLALRTAMWRYLPEVEARRVNGDAVRSIFVFAQGVLATTVLGAILSQADKAVLSRAVALEVFGRYTLAATLATATGVAASAVSLAFMPRFAAAAARADEAELTLAYHRAGQLMAVLLLPVGAVLAVFPAESLMIWTGQPAVAQAAAPFLRLLVIGFVLNGLATVPYTLQIACGWTSLWVRVNTIAVLLIVPAMITAASFAGGKGTASMWIALNAAYCLIGVPLMHARLLRGEASRWGMGAIRPAIATAVVLALFRIAMPLAESRAAVAVELAMIGCAAGLSAILVSPLVRTALMDAFGGLSWRSMKP